MINFVVQIFGVNISHFLSVDCEHGEGRAPVYHVYNIPQRPSADTPSPLVCCCVEEIRMGQAPGNGN